MWGAATHDRSEGIHRPLRATLLRLEAPEADSHSAPLLWLSLDLCLFGPPEVELVKNEIRAALGRDEDALVIVFSHTHGAGLLTLDRQTLPGGEAIPDYLRAIGRQAARAIEQTVHELVPAHVVYGNGWCDLAAHRDLWDRQRHEFVCGYHPDGPTDGTVLVARVTDTAGKPLAQFVNYACHPTTLAWDNRLVSPDFIGAMREVVERETGAPCFFIQGASGDLGPVEGFVGDVAVADRNGRQLGFAALSALTALPPSGTQYEYAGAVVSGATIGTWRHIPITGDRAKAVQLWNHRRWILPLEYRPELPTIEQVHAERQQWEAEERKALEQGDAGHARQARAMLERQTRMLARLEQLPPGPHYPYRIDLWRMGDALWVAVPGELYSLFQVELRAAFPSRPIVVATMAQGWGPSYIPTAETYGKGIYQESIAIVAPGSLEKIIDEVRAAIACLLEGV